MTDHPAKYPWRTLDLLCRVEAAVAYSYEAGTYPDELDDDVRTYLDGDGGLLRALRDARDLAKALDQAQGRIRQLRKQRDQERVLIHLYKERIL